MKLLAIDTSTENCSVALSIDNKITSLSQVTPKEHSQKLLSMVKELLHNSQIDLSQIDALAYGQGPGSFTGLRISASIVQAFAFSLDIPVLGVSTLKVLAQQALRLNPNLGYIIPMIDARMNEVYWSTYKINKKKIYTLSAEVVSPYHKITFDYDKPFYGIGNGWKHHTNFTCPQISFDQSSYPQAQDVATIAINNFSHIKHLKPEQVIPTYIRNDVALRKKK